MAQAFFGGVHPHDMKAATNEKAIEQLAPPAVVVIPMSMHFGAPCTPLVQAGDHVKVGQKIGEFHGLGAPIHASVSGTVKAVEPRPYSMGGNMMSVVIENDSIINAYLMTSANPADSSRAGKVLSVLISASTICGCQNAPIMFLPWGWLIPVLPPTLESTCDSKVVGI